MVTLEPGLENGVSTASSKCASVPRAAQSHGLDLPPVPVVDLLEAWVEKNHECF